MKQLLIGAAGVITVAMLAPSASATVFTPGDPQFQVFGDITNGTVSATIGNFGIAAGAFTDEFQFTIDQTGLGSGSLSTSTSVFHGPTDVDITSVTINGITATKTTDGPQNLTEFFSAIGIPINFGVLNDIVIVGTSRGNGSYGGNLTFVPAAVPEVGTWAMMLGGFGVIGGALRNRRKVAVNFG